MMHPEQEQEIEETLEGIEQAQGRPEDDAAEEQKAPEAEKSDEALKAELEETKLSWARERADFSNYRKRMVEEMAKARTSAIMNFVRSLIPVVDNLDLVLAAPTEDPAVKNFVIGVDMIRSEFLNILSREGIRPEVDVGSDFDPYLMEAVELDEREDFEGEKVDHVYKKAYVMISEGGERQVLRPATVRVLRGKRKDVEQEAENEEENAN